MAHITGGGLPENLPRCLGKGQSMQIDPKSWTIPPIFQWLATAGSVNAEAMYNTFNMGIGFVLLIPPHQVEQTLQFFAAEDTSAFVIGEVITGEGTLVGL
jgi:phosphoribosylformylglycinamidine cyclo-ligase